MRTSWQHQHRPHHCWRMGRPGTQRRERCWAAAAEDSDGTPRRGQRSSARSPARDCETDGRGGPRRTEFDDSWKRGSERPSPETGLEEGENRLKQEEAQTVSRRHPPSKATAAKDACGRGAPVVQMNEKSLKGAVVWRKAAQRVFLPARVVVSRVVSTVSTSRGCPASRVKEENKNKNSVKKNKQCTKKSFFFKKKDSKKNKQTALKKTNSVKKKKNKQSFFFLKKKKTTKQRKKKKPNSVKRKQPNSVKRKQPNSVKENNRTV